MFYNMIFQWLYQGSMLSLFLWLTHDSQVPVTLTETPRSLEAISPTVMMALTKLQLLWSLATGHSQSEHAQFCSGQFIRSVRCTWKRYEGDTLPWKLTRATGTDSPSKSPAVSILHSGEDPFRPPCSPWGILSLSGMEMRAHCLDRPRWGTWANFRENAQLKVTAWAQMLAVLPKHLNF